MIIRRIVLGVLIGAVATFGVSSAASVRTADLTQTVVYGTDPAQTFDVTYDPAETGQPWVALVHGGSWAAGTTANSAVMAARLHADGFVTVNIEYRLSYGEPGAPWPAQRDDVAAALAFVRTHASDYGIDPARGALYGFSAGAHIAAVEAETAGSEVRGVVSVAGPLQPDRNLSAVLAGTATEPQATLALQAVAVLQCGNWAWTACADRWTSFKPDKHFHPGGPPLYLVQGDADQVVFPITASSVCYWAARNGVSCTLVMVAGAGHDETVLLRNSSARYAAMLGWLRARTA